MTDGEKTLSIGENTPIKMKIGDLRSLLKTHIVKVKTVGGTFQEVTDFVDKGVLSAYMVVLENGKFYKGTSNHRVFCETGWIDTDQLIVGVTKLLCEDKAFYTVVAVEPIGKRKIVDISVPAEECYFSNGILHHNTGKSYLAALAIANAQKMGFLCVLFDSEMAADTSFLASLGVDVDKLVYVAVQDVEMYFEIMEELFSLDEKLFIVWDTPANTKAREETDKSYSPGSTMALKARTISKGFAKIFDLIMEKRPTILICNQLKRNLDQATSMIEPWVTPGGETIKYLSSLTLQLTTRKAKKHQVLGDNEHQIGSDVKVKITKSRFGSLNRECAFKIIWNGPEKGIMDEESWVEAMEPSDYVQTGAWNTLYMNDEKTEEIKFTRAGFTDLLKSNPEFKKRVLWVIQEELVNQFQVKASSETAKKFYNVDDNSEVDEEL